MQLRDHGGSCCGRRHIVGMNGATTDSIRQFMQNNALLSNDPDEVNKLVEIVISEENDDLEQLHQEVAGAGFVRVASWYNCSGSHCHMYVFANEWEAYPNGAAARQLNLVRPAAPAPRVEVPAPRRIVHSTYHNVLRDGRSDAGWSSWGQARDAAPRARAISRKDIYSDGTVEWAENVG